jgi:hypothetical protein
VLGWLAASTACACAITDPLESTDGDSGNGGTGHGATGAAASTSAMTGGFGDASGGGGGSAAGCKGVDLLFVIDNSPSMSPYQEGLSAAFPGFIDAAFAALPTGIEVHVGITTTSFYSANCSESVINCVSQASPETIQAHYTTPQTGNNGINGSQGRLFIHQGKAFDTAITGEDPTALKNWFGSAATAAGETGCSFEMPAAGAAYVAHEANASTNAGFLRDEGAVLVVFILSDEPDKSPEGTAYYGDLLRSAKSTCGGDACILAAGLVDYCVSTGQNELKNFLDSFGEPALLGDIGAPGQYSSLVGNVLATAVDENCDEIAAPR